MIAGLQRGHALAHFDHHAGAFVAQHGGEQALGSSPLRVKASVWQTPVCVMRTSTSRARRHVDFNDFQRLAGSECDCCA